MGQISTGPTWKLIAEGFGAERDEARRWSAAWKRAAKNNREWRHVIAHIAGKQIRRSVKLEEERDEARTIARRLYAENKRLKEQLEYLDNEVMEWIGKYQKKIDEVNP